MPAVMLKDADVQEIDVKEHGKKLAQSWKNKDLPLEQFVTDLPLWQQRFVPLLIDWANCSISESFWHDEPQGLQDNNFRPLDEDLLTFASQTRG